MNEILIEIRETLKENSDGEIKEGDHRFFKEAVRLYGIKTAVVNQIAKEFFNKIKDFGKSRIFDVCGELWHSGIEEESIIACRWSYFLHKKYEKKDLEIFESWLEKYVSNWASCDTLCNHTIGTYLEMYPARVVVLMRWAKSENRWMRRASAVSLIIPAKKGKFLKELFEIADLLLTDKDDLVQKSYGWMLKAASQSHPKKVFDYVMKNKQKMSRTALRYAIEKMPPEWKTKAMERRNTDEPVTKEAY